MVNSSTTPSSIASFTSIILMESVDNLADITNCFVIQDECIYGMYNNLSSSSEESLTDPSNNWLHYKLKRSKPEISLTGSTSLLNTSEDTQKV